MPAKHATIRALHNAKFYRRFLLMGLGALAVMGWFLRDGLYTWPNQHERYVAYRELVDDLRGSEWETLAEERGWPAEPPEKDRTEAEINGQFWSAGVCGIIGVILLLKVWLPRGRWIEADGEKITTSWGQTVAYSAVEQIDKRSWQKKGIARIKYRDGDRTKSFVLDDFKFTRQATDDILVQLEEVAGADKITGGPSEAEIEAARQASDPQASGPEEEE